MNLSCGIIKDLLPLYFDGVCSNDSKAIVEEHIKTCDSCKAELLGMEMSLPIGNVERNIKEAEAINMLSKRWKKGMMKSLLEGTLITLIVIALIALFLFLFVDVQVVRTYTYSVIL